MARVLVTGSTGYIGRNLMNRLLREPDVSLTGLSRSQIRLENEEDYQKIEAVTGDLLTLDLPRLMKEVQPEVVYHTVGINPLASFQDQMLVHCEGTRRLLHALVETDSNPKVVVVGSAAEYGLQPIVVNEDTHPKPEGEYGICKLAQTQIAMTYAKRYNLRVTVGRVFNVYGMTSPALVVSSLASQIARSEHLNQDALQVAVKNLASTRDFIHVSDVAAGLMALAQRGHNGAVYNIASGEATRIRTVLEMLCGFSTIQDAEIRSEADQSDDFSQADISKISAHTGWKPVTSLEEGLRQELDYWRHKIAQQVSANA